MHQKLIWHWPILLLIILTFILRIVKLEQLFYFTYDESIPAFVARRIILWQHIPLIGGVTPFGFHLAPYFYWLYTPILYLGYFNPIAWGYASAGISVLTTLMIFLVGKTFGNKKIAITACILWTFSYLANLYDRHLWALYWGPLTSLVVLFSLYQIIKGSQKFVYVLGAVIALSIHADPSNLVFLLLAIVTWIIFRLPIKKSTFIALGLILFSFLPLVIFDIRHNFANTKPIIQFWAQGRNNPGLEIQKFMDNTLLFPKTFSRLFYAFGDHEVSKQYSYCRVFVEEKFNSIPWPVIIISAVLLLTFIIWNLKSRFKNEGWRLISLLIFRADIFEHYITGAFAVFLLIFAKSISILPKKLWLIFLAIFVFFNIYKLSQARNNLGLTQKRQAIEYTMSQVGDNPFSLDSLSTCWKLSGYRYLFTVFGKEPVKSYVDPNFSYLYGTTPVATKHPPIVVSFVAHDFVPETEEFYKRYAVLKSHEAKNALFGNIEVIILDNSKGWFDK